MYIPIARVLYHSKTDFCRLNEGPINLSISINTFPHEQTNICQTAWCMLFMAVRDTRKIGPVRAFRIDGMYCVSSIPQMRMAI